MDRRSWKSLHIFEKTVLQEVCPAQYQFYNDKLVSEISLSTAKRQASQEAEDNKHLILYLCTKPFTWEVSTQQQKR